MNKFKLKYMFVFARHAITMSFYDKKLYVIIPHMATSSEAAA
jgi:hypothetical protein